MSDRFDALIGEIFRHEGGYVFDPADPGGETNFGISKRAHPDVDIANLTAEKAEFIYRKSYWRTWMEQIDDTVLVLQVFDFGVNAGLPRTAKMLQKTAGVTQDGIIGPVTLKALNNVGNTVYLRRRFAENCLLYYHGLAMNREPLDKFMQSWFRRVLENVVR